MENTYYAMNPWWEGRAFNAGIPRPAYLKRMRKMLEREPIEMVAGGRRVGKTTLMRQLLAEQVHGGGDPTAILYLALDHPRLVATPLSEHLRFFRSLFKIKRDRRLLLVFDEVQESPDWERELKALHDHENVKIICTGSTAALLSSQGGGLTGRRSLLTVYPLDFREFLSFREYDFSRAEDYRFVTAAEEYLQVGGYPEQVLHPSDEYLPQLLQDIVSRDVLRLGRVRRPELMHDLLRLVAAGTGARTSYNRLSKVLDISVDTVKDYLSHLSEAYLIGTLQKWTTSYKERVYAQKKIYMLDSGLKTVLTGTGDTVHKAEAAVFADFRRREADCGYYAESRREVDFVLGAPDSPRVIESKYENTLDWDSRKYDGVRLFLNRFPECRDVTVVTRDAVAEIDVNGAKVKAIPLWRYLLRD